MSQAFDPAEIPLDGLRLIEASAGTGKTFSLAGLYLRLIVEQDASVREILVMTFTRAATRELRERIRARLADAARIAHAPEHADPDNPEHRFALQVLERQAAEPAVLARRLADAAARLDEATIVTIHGFAQRAGSEHAFDSALAFERGERVEDADIQQQMSADYWREQVLGTEANTALLALWPTPEHLYQSIKPVLMRPHAQLVGSDTAELQASLAALAAAWPEVPAALTAALEAAVANNAIKNSGLKNRLAAFASAADFVADLDARIRRAIDTGTAPVLDEAVAELATPASFINQRGKAKRACAAAFTAIEALQTLAQITPLAYAMHVEQAVSAVRRRAVAHKLAHRQYSYDDLIRALYESLHAPGGERLAAALQARWPYALVDEFQDTDPLQYASLRRIYLQTASVERNALLLIGDPKQAIYGFRGGDIFAYLAAAQNAGAERRYTLTTNYRSTQPVLDAIEALYRWPQSDPFLVPEIDFPSVRAGCTAADRTLVTGDGEVAALTFWQLQGGERTNKKGKQKNPNVEDDKKRLTQQLIARIACLLDGQSAWWQHADGSTSTVAAHDIAILVNKNEEAMTLQARLAQHGLMAVCQHQQSVYKSHEAEDLYMVLRAMAAPDDVRAVRAAQPSALIGKRLGDLIRLADDDQALQQAIAQAQELHETWAAGGVLSALEQLFISAAPRLLALADGERRMSNYLQLGELLAHAEAASYGMHSLVRRFGQRIEAATAGATLADEDDSLLRLESDAELIRISTVHKAKGLEYPLVFLPFAPWLGTAGKPGKPPLVLHDADGAACIDVVGTGDQHRQQALLEAQSEALRLLYVALTRAEQALFVGWRAPDDYRPASALDNLLYRAHDPAADPLQALARSQPQTIAVEALAFDTPVQAPVLHHRFDGAALGEARSDLPAARPRWSTYSFSRLARAAPATQPTLPEPGAEDELAPASALAPTALATDDEKLPLLDQRLAGTRFGSAVHDVLEAAKCEPEYAHWPRPGTAGTDLQRALVQNRLRAYGLLGDHADDPRIGQTVDLVARTLHAPLPDLGPLVALPHARLRAEMGFMLRLRGARLGELIDTLRGAGYLPAALGGDPRQTLYGLMQGFIDVVAEAAGRYYVLDYKTNHLGDTAAAYAPAALQQAMSRAHYDLQYLLYSVALHRHLRRCLGTAYDSATQLGGVHYLFVRAMDGASTAGVFSDRPDPALIEALDALFDLRIEVI